MRQQVFIPLVLLFAFLFNAPILSAMDRLTTAFQGIPVIFLYLFGIWAILIGLLYWFTQTRKTR